MNYPYYKISRGTGILPVLWYLYCGTGILPVLIIQINLSA